MTGVRIHQMHAPRPSLPARRLRRLSAPRVVLPLPRHRDRFAEGTIDLVPNHFSQVPDLSPHHHRSARHLHRVTARSPRLLLARHERRLCRVLHRQARFFVEANPKMPRTLGRNQIHISQVVGWNYHDVPLVEIEPATPTDIDRRLAGFVAERVADGSCIQTGIGTIPNAIVSSLMGHRDLGIHTELISDGIVDLIEAGVATGCESATTGPRPSARSLGSAKVYEFLADNPAVELWLNYVNNPGSSPTSRTSSPSTQRSRSICSASVRPRPSPGATGPPVEASPISPRRVPVGQGQRVHRAAIHRPERHRLANRARVPPRHGDHDVEEHRRSCRHRVGGGPTAGPLDRAAGTGAGLDRRSVVPRRAHGGGGEVRIPVRRRTMVAAAGGIRRRWHDRPCCSPDRTILAGADPPPAAGDGRAPDRPQRHADRRREGARKRGRQRAPRRARGERRSARRRMWPASSVR